MNQTELLEFTKTTAKGAGAILMQHFGMISTVKRKSTHIDLVTIADTESESFILNQIKAAYPQHHIIAEESAIVENNSDYRWVIDPLDGTTNFIHNLPIFAVSIGLQYKDETIVAVVYNPAADKCFYAEKDKGSFLNNSIINTRENTNLSKSLLATGFPYLHDKRYDLSFDIFKNFYDKINKKLGEEIKHHFEDMYSTGSLY